MPMITKPLKIVWQFRRQTFILQHGPETFYDEDDCLIEFETADEARQWAISILGIDPQSTGPEPKDDVDQLPLFKKGD